MVAIYGASKLKHAEMWKELRITHPFVHWTARWPDIVGKVADDSENAQVFWEVDLEDAFAADFVMVYGGDPEDKLRGALVEAGVALGAGKRVIVIGNHPDYGTWQYNGNVFRASSIEHGLWMARYMMDEKRG